MRKIIGELLYVLIFAAGTIYCINWNSPYALAGSIFFGFMLGRYLYDFFKAIDNYKNT